MSITTYAELQTAITNWTHRDGLSSYAPDFITLGEARLQREIRSRDMEQRATSTLSSTSAYINVPSDLLSVRAVWLTSGGVNRRLQYVTPDVLMAMFTNASASGEPTHYTIIGDEMRFGPVPDSAYTAEIWYYKRLAALSSAVSTLFTNNPDLYLAAAMVEAYTFAVNPDKAAFWEARYQTIKKQVNDTEESGRRAQGMQIVVA